MNFTSLTYPIDFQVVELKRVIGIVEKAYNWTAQRINAMVRDGEIPDLRALIAEWRQVAAPIWATGRNTGMYIPHTLFYS